MALAAITNMNLVTLVGVLNRPPQWRVLKGGRNVTNLDVKVREPSGESGVLPVSWFAAPASALDLAEGDVVAVIGRMRRQWRGDKTNFIDVVAERVVPVKSPARVRKLLTEAMVTLQEAAP